MLTELGKELRRIRIDHDERMIDMAGKLAKSAAFISAIETGKKCPPSGFEEIVINSYRLAAGDADKLREASDRSRKSFTLHPRSALGRHTAGLIVRTLNDLTPSEMEEILTILRRGKMKANNEIGE